jgi:G3E family GTPase
MADYAALTPVNVITGFLGSGKTTLLQRLLRAPQLREVAVLVNEFGEVGLDHHLVQNVAESILLLENGCVCCTIRGDLQQALRELLSRRSHGQIPFFRRIVIETSGLADPVPIAYTLLAEPIIRHHFRLANIVTTIDAVNARRQLAGFAEARKQVGVADRLVLTKTDLADRVEVRRLTDELSRLNASALRLEPAAIAADASILIEDIYDANAKQREIAGWFVRTDARPAVAAAPHAHTDGVHSFTLIFGEPLDWSAFGIWCTMLLHCHGANVLRMKGLLNIAGVATPVLINGVQHIVHPPSHLEAWPDGDRRSRLVFIVRGLTRQVIERSLQAFHCLVNPTLPNSDDGRP